MVASRQVELPFYEGNDQKRGRRIGKLEQCFGRTAIPSLRKYIVSAAKRVGADMLEFSSLVIAACASCRIIIQTAAKSVGIQLWENIRVVVAGKGVQAVWFHQNLQNKPVSLQETILLTFLNFHLKYF